MKTKTRPHRMGFLIRRGRAFAFMRLGCRARNCGGLGEQRLNAAPCLILRSG